MKFRHPNTKFVDFADLPFFVAARKFQVMRMPQLFFERSHRSEHASSHRDHQYLEKQIQPNGRQLRDIHVELFSMTIPHPMKHNITT